MMQIFIVPKYVIKVFYLLGDNFLKNVCTIVSYRIGCRTKAERPFVTVLETGILWLLNSRLGKTQYINYYEFSNNPKILLCHCLQ